MKKLPGSSKKISPEGERYCELYRIVSDFQPAMREQDHLLDCILLLSTAMMGVSARWHMRLILRKQILRLCAIAVVLTLGACSSGSGISEGTSGEISDIPGEIPMRYRDLENPLAGDAEALARGTEAYQALCSQCHGADGKGDGSEALGFDPAPGDLTRAAMAAQPDGYLYWRIADGGVFEPYNSLMPAWGTLLSETEIWELVSFLRDLSG
jgi:cytochrome c553